MPEFTKEGIQTTLRLHRPKVVKRIMKAVGIKSKKDKREELKSMPIRTKLHPMIAVSEVYIFIFFIIHVRRNL